MCVRCKEALWLIDSKSHLSAFIINTWAIGHIFAILFSGWDYILNHLEIRSTSINVCISQNWSHRLTDVFVIDVLSLLIKLKFYERSVTNWPHQQQTKSRKSLASRESSSVGMLASIKCTQSISRDTKSVTYFDQNIRFLLAELTSRVHVQNIAIIQPCLSLWLWDYKRQFLHLYAVSPIGQMSQLKFKVVPISLCKFKMLCHLIFALIYFVCNSCTGCS